MTDRLPRLPAWKKALLAPLFFVARWEPAAVVAAVRVFDFDDLGAELGEQPGADVAGEKAGEIEDARPMEGRDHAASIARAGTSPP